MKNKWIFIAILIVNCFLSAFSQVLLKKASIKKYRSVIWSYLNPLVISGYGLFFIVLCTNVFLLKFLPLSVVNPVTETLPVVLSFLFGYLIFGESISVRKILGLFFIVIGIAVILI